MKTENIELIVNEIINRMRKNVLLILTGATGYQNEIYTRLQCCQRATFTIWIDEQSPHFNNGAQWASLGRLIKNKSELINDLARFDILLPFLDFQTVSSLVNGIITNSATEIISQAMLRNVSVMAFNYQCNPQSELNAILGLNQNKEYATLMEQNLIKASSLGIRFLSVDEFEQYSDRTNSKMDKSLPVSSKSSRYITLKDILDKKVTRIDHSMILTDLAADYAKDHQLFD